MTEEEELQQAVELAEAESARLEAVAEQGLATRAALTAQALAEALGRRDTVEAEREALVREAEALAAERDSLRAAAARPGPQLPGFIGGPLGWFLRVTAAVVYLGSLVSAHRYLHSAGLVLAAVVALPIAFILLLVAGSLRESGSEEAPRVGAGEGEGTRALPAVDRSLDPAAGTPVDAGVAAPADGGVRERTGGGS